MSLIRNWDRHRDRYQRGRCDERSTLVHLVVHGELCPMENKVTCATAECSGCAACFAYRQESAYRSHMCWSLGATYNISQVLPVVDLPTLTHLLRT